MPPSIKMMIFIEARLAKNGGPGKRRRRVWPTSNFTVGHDRTPESAGKASPIDLTGRAD